MLVGHLRKNQPVSTKLIIVAFNPGLNILSSALNNEVFYFIKISLLPGHIFFGGSLKSISEQKQIGLFSDINVPSDQAAGYYDSAGDVRNP